MAGAAEAAQTSAEGCSGPAHKATTMIQVRDLTKHYADLKRGRLVALSGLNFRAEAGQVYGLLGPNGAGKTTALRILSTVLRPTTGSATVCGYEVVTQPSHVRRCIGFMSANTAVYDRMTALGAVFGAQIR